MYDGIHEVWKLPPWGLQAGMQEDQAGSLVPAVKCAQGER